MRAASGLIDRNAIGGVPASRTDCPKWRPARGAGLLSGTSEVSLGAGKRPAWTAFPETLDRQRNETLLSHMKQNTTASIAPQSPRERILLAAATVWAADPSAPLDTIARAAGVGRATLHRHFPSRVDLLRTAALDGIDAMARAIADARLEACRPAEALDLLVDLLVPFGDRLHFLLVTGDLLADPELAAAEATIDAPIRRLLDAAAADGVLRAGVPSAWRFRALESLLYAAWTAVAAGEVARLEASALVRDAFRCGFGAEPGVGALS